MLFRLFKFGPCSKVLLIFWLGEAMLSAQSGDKRGERQLPLPAQLQPPPAPVLSPDEALRSIQLAPGFRIELVASEPMVQDPVAITFDENGRLWVVEMRGYMPDINGRDEDAPAGRISVLEDVDGDGRMDKRTVFLDGLVSPRAIARVNGGVLFVAAGKLSFAQDTDNDGRADKISVVDPDYVLGGNPEHQPNGLLRGLDNWFYSANSTWRYRFNDGEWIREKTEFRGQWGITQNNYGRLFYNVNESQLRGDVAPPGYLNRNAHFKTASGINLLVATNQRVFPIRMNTGVNRGYRSGILDDQGRLREFTSACAPLIYRGDNFPAEFQGNAFVCEPAANLVKRNLVFEEGLQLTSRQAYENSEFAASTDERFRPVNACNAPDGTLYLVDMHRGIVQHRAYMTTHLRNEILSRGLDQPVHLGRIYRIVNAASTPAKAPRLLTEDSANLVEHLSHPNGWWRDTAQRLLIERADRSVMSGLIRLALQGTNHLGRIHALWTLEGLRLSTPEALLHALDDLHPQVQIAAIRVLESLSAGKPEFQNTLSARLRAMSATADSEVQFQIALSLGSLPQPEALAALHGIITQRADSSLLRDAVVSGLNQRESQFLRLLVSDSAWVMDKPGRGPLLRAVASAIVKERQPGHIEALLDMATDQPSNRSWQQKALLAGVGENVHPQFNPVQLKARPVALDRLIKSDDPFVREQSRNLEGLFAWPGHQPVQPTTPKARPLSAEEKEMFALGQKQYLQVCYGCHGIKGEGITPVAPPLANSAWVLGPEARLVRILLHGLEGPVHVNGTRYEPPLSLREMPALQSLDDNALAAMLTYVRREWGHQATPIRPETVGKIRKATEARRAFWTEEELLNIK